MQNRARAARRVVRLLAVIALLLASPSGEPRWGVSLAGRSHGVIDSDVALDVNEGPSSTSSTSTPGEEDVFLAVGIGLVGESRRHRRRITGKPPKTLYELVRGKALAKAWKVVRRNGLTSQSPRTRDDTKLFDAQADTHLLHIRLKLARKKFSFPPQKGVLGRKRSGRGLRPIIIAEIKSRIVQRAILEVLVECVPEVQKVLRTPTSFGGIRELSTSAAIACAIKAIRQGASFFVRSDINGFFTKIPRREIGEFLSKYVGDREFLDLFEAATTTELANEAELGEKGAALFPLGMHGVAQGNPLSPLMGNILLRDFDRELNKDRITCLRYIDDFLLMGSTESAVASAFRRATELLRQFGMKTIRSSSPERQGVNWSDEEWFRLSRMLCEPGFRRTVSRSTEKAVGKGGCRARVRCQSDGEGTQGQRDGAFREPLCPYPRAGRSHHSRVGALVFVLY